MYNFNDDIAKFFYDISVYDEFCFGKCMLMVYRCINFIFISDVFIYIVYSKLN